MPFFGYHLGCVFSKLVQAYDHYIAFIFLMIVGIGMLKDAFSEEETSYNFHFFDLTILAIATSIDAFAIGMTFAFLEVSIYKALFILIQNALYSFQQASHLKEYLCHSQYELCFFHISDQVYV